MYHKNKYLYNKKDNPGWDGTHNDYLFMDEREFKHNTRRSDKTPYCVINYPDKIYILKKKPKYQIIAEKEPCDNTICLHVLANCIVLIQCI